MSRLVDLSMIPDESDKHAVQRNEPGVKLNWRLGGVTYTGVIFSLNLNSMAGIYLDLPGHIA